MDGIFHEAFQGALAGSSLFMFAMYGLYRVDKRENDWFGYILFFVPVALIALTLLPTIGNYSGQ